jgi:hypothetical protein
MGLLWKGKPEPAQCWLCSSDNLVILRCYNCNQAVCRNHSNTLIDAFRGIGLELRKYPVGVICGYCESAGLMDIYNRLA